MNETDVLASTSMDQILARELGKTTQLGSLEVSMDKFANAGQCTAGLSCAYTQTISWRTPTMPLPMENNPRAVFERLFGDSGSADPAVRRARRQQKQSILDSVTDKLTDLKVAVGPRDRVKLDEYTEAVRDVERRIQLAEQQRDVEPTFTEQPSAPPRVFEEHLGLMFDLQFLALQADLTRVVTFMMGREQSTRSYPQIGVPDAHHPLSHHEDDPERIAVMSKINAYHAKLASDYLARLRRGGGRRRVAARQHDHPLRRGHLQQHAAPGRQPAAGRPRRRRRQAEGRPAPAVSGRHLERRPADDADGQARHAARPAGRQHDAAADRHTLGGVTQAEV